MGQARCRAAVTLNNMLSFSGLWLTMERCSLLASARCVHALSSCLQQTARAESQLLLVLNGSAQNLLEAFRCLCTHLTRFSEFALDSTIWRQITALVSTQLGPQTSLTDEQQLVNEREEWQGRIAQPSSLYRG